MAWWLPWERITVSAALSTDEVQRRLAAATADWSASGWGSPVPPPPWAGADFVAAKGAAGLSVLPVVVIGTVRPEGSGTRLEATVRPHGSAVFGTAAFVIFAGVTAPYVGLVLALLAYLLFLGLSRARVGPVAALLREACR